MILVTGGSSSGKSAYAESLLAEKVYEGACCGDSAAKYYIATMQVWDDEDRARVDKHQKMREGKGFRTIEQPVNLIDALDKIRAETGELPAEEARGLSAPASEGARKSSASTSECAQESSTSTSGGEWGQKPVCALVECISNLTANEMFRDEGTEHAGTRMSSDIVTNRIVEQVKALDDALDRLVVVTNNLFEDGTEYEPPTMEYLRALGEINRQLATRAERVIEVVSGIPVELKSL